MPKFKTVYYSFVIPLICAALVFAGCAAYSPAAEAAPAAAGTETAVSVMPPAAKTASSEPPLFENAAPVSMAQTGEETLSLLFAGDVMAHNKQLRCHKFGTVYDFTGDYKYISGIVSQADVSVVNLETVLSGKKPYSGLPPFNAPDSLADALKSAGFNVIGTANNHIRDMGNAAMMRTSELLRGKGLTVIGTRGGLNETKYALIEKNGIKVGLVNFTVSINRGIPASAEDYVNCLRRGSSFSKGLEILGSEIRTLKDEGAEFIAVYVHWGSEFHKENSTEKRLAQSIADLGADLIVGSHPHCLQGVAEYKSAATGKNVLVYYSLGNLVSNQGYNYGAGKGTCETGALALIRLKRNGDGAVAIESAGYLATYVHKPKIEVRYADGGKTRIVNTQAYYIVPAADAAQNPSAYEGVRGVLLKRIQQGVKNAKEIIGASGEALVDFDFMEYVSFPW